MRDRRGHELFTVQPVSENVGQHSDRFVCVEEDGEPSSTITRVDGRSTDPSEQVSGSAKLLAPCLTSSMRDTEMPGRAP